MEYRNSSNNVVSFVRQEHKQYFKNVANSFAAQKIIMISKIPNQNSHSTASQDETSDLETSVLIVDENYNKKKITFNKTKKNSVLYENDMKLEDKYYQKINNEITLTEQIKKSEKNYIEHNKSNSSKTEILNNESQISKINDISEILNVVQSSQRNNVIIASQIYIANNLPPSFIIKKDSHSDAFIDAVQKKSNGTFVKQANLLSFIYKQNLPKIEGEKLQQSEIFSKNLNLDKLNCFYCGKHFDKLFNLQQHERIHTGERPFQCIICGRAFSQKSNVIKHMARHKVWPKPTLTINFKPNKKNQQSMKENLIDLMNYSCQYCSLSFKSYSLLKKHLIVHSDVKVYRCIQKTCYETFKDIDEFLSHSKKHSSSEFLCHICLKPFTNLEDLGEHQYEHNKNDPKLTKSEKKGNSKRLKCKICCAQFKSIQSYQNHLAVDTHKYECVQCKNVFSSERALRRHLNLHIREQTSSQSNASQFECQFCKKSFQSKATLKTHEFAHLSEKLFNCDQCDKQFSSKVRLQRHLSSHLSVFFECPYKNVLGCDKTFQTKDNLKNHVQSHRQTRKCKICLKSFTSFSQLNRHFDKEHLHGKNKKFLRCKDRSKLFRNQKQCTEHHFTTDENEFKKSTIETGKLDKENEKTISNIEIIMVPFDSYTEETKKKN